jgi:hypothetical protein
MRQCNYPHVYGTYEPSPSGTLNRKGSGIELLFHVVEATKRMANSILQWAILQSASVSLALGMSRGKILPEQRVVDMS